MALAVTGACGPAGHRRPWQLAVRGRTELGLEPWQQQARRAALRPLTVP